MSTAVHFRNESPAMLHAVFQLFVQIAYNETELAVLMNPQSQPPMLDCCRTD